MPRPHIRSSVRVVAALALAAGLAGAAIPAGAQPVVSAQQGPVVIEVDHPFVDESQFIDEVEEIRADLVDAERISPPTPPGRAAANGGGIVVNYLVNGQSSMPPADVRAVVSTAMNRWNAVLDTDQMIVIDFAWQPLSQSLLGYGGPTTIHLDNLPAVGAWYPSALANDIAGTDLNGDLAEIEITLDSGRYDPNPQASGWYVDVSAGNPPPGTRDLLSTVIHEIAHGLGFLGSAIATDASPGGQMGDHLLVYDLLVDFNDTPLLQAGNPDSHLRSNQLTIDIGGGKDHHIYAPTTFFNGSSFSHFDEIYGPGQPGALMTPVLNSGEIERTIGGATLAVMEGIGWNLLAGPAPATLTGLVPGTGTLTVEWDVSFATAAVLPPDSFQVELRRDGAVVSVTTVPGINRAVTFTNLTNFADYEATVIPITGNKSATPTVGAVEGRPLFLGAAGSGASRTLSWAEPTAPGSNNASYRVDRRIVGTQTWQTVGTTSSTQLVDSGIAEGIYQYSVVATSAAGTSERRLSPIVGVGATSVRPMPLDGQIARLYAASLGRAPDGTGLDFWLQQRAAGMTLNNVANAFTGSPEFVTSYGDLNNDQFIDQVYINVFGRAADAEGAAYWRGRLAGGLSRGDMMIGFSESPEYVGQTGTAAVQTPNQGQVYRLYLAYFLREPDAGGFAHWTTQRNSGVAIRSISGHFAQSDEFVDTYGSLSDARFVDLVYRNVLGRNPDAGGRASWLEQLGNGMSRGDMMIGFSESREFILQTGTIL